ncbi:MAG TPA: hypothetical protein VNU71_12580 [Burkholderiaceae bacterium]|nr:hypothetical protein [Burkholderiaceae bacterium]
MTISSSALAFAAALALGAAAPAVIAQTAAAPAAKKPAPTKTATPKKAVPAKKVVEPPPPANAGPDQVEAAGRVYYGIYDCEFKQTIDIVASPKYPAYVDVKHGKADYLMKPVLSSTGAIRLEDVRGETLMVQIASKSMLLNVKTAQRIVDDCVSPKQRELIEAARAAKAAQVAAAAASAADTGASSNTASTPSASAPPATDSASAAVPASNAASMTTLSAPQTK